jgi:pimeloyl-ACP methyl ester carboxylesterase
VIQYPLLIDGTLTRVLEAGREGEAIVFLHGVGARADRWAGTVERVAAHGFHTFAFDLPGHGFAQKGDGFPYGVAGFAGLLESLLDTLRLEHAHIVGTSLGGHISAYFACQSSTRARSLTLVGTTGIVPIGAQARKAIGDSIRITSLEGIRAKLHFVLADNALVTDEFVREEFRINNSPGADAAFGRLGDYFAEMIDDDIVGPALSSLPNRPPVLLIWGELDRIVPISVGHAVHDMLAGSDLKVIPNVGHAPYFECPAAFDRALLGFLKNASPHAQQSNGGCASGPKDKEQSYGRFDV